MAYLTGREHFVPFRILDINSNPVTGLTLADFTVIFNRDLSVAAETLTVTDEGNGFYYASYTPAEPGFFYLDIYHAATGIRVVDEQEIDDATTLFGTSNLVDITQDYPTTGALVSTVSNPQNYTLLFYMQSDWALGNTDQSYAVALTQLDASGNWLTPILTLASGTYTVVLMNTSRSVLVFMAALNVHS